MQLSASTTIGELKSRLYDAFEEHPEPDNQRLIYGGKICSDNSETLRSVLRSFDEPQIFHMALRIREKPESVSHDLSSDALGAVKRGYERHLALAALYSEALDQGRWTGSSLAGNVDGSPFGVSRPPSGRGFPGISPANAPLHGPPPQQQGRRALMGEVIAAIRENPLVAALDVRLAIKLLFGVVLLGHDSSKYRIAMLVCIAILTFVFQTGIADIAFNYVGQTPNAVFATEWRRLVHRAVTSGHIPSPAPNSSIFSEIAIFVGTFLVSLHPAWRPALPEGEEEQQQGRQHAD